MIAAVILWLLLSLVFAAFAPALAARSRPAYAVRLVVVSAVAITVAGVFVMCASALTWAAQRPSVADVGEWSTTKLRADDPIPRVIAIGCAILLVGSTASLVTHALRRGRAVRSVRTAVRMIKDPNDVIVLDDDGVADAFATPGRRGRIIVTSGLMNALTAPEREALIAHERSHLDHRHTRWLQAMHAAAAAGPWLRRTCRAIDHAVERWADEDAATVVGDRRLVARTLARASLLKKHGSDHGRLITMAATGGDVPARVRALLAPPSTRGRGAALVLTLFVVGAALIVVVMERNADALFDSAQIR